MLTADLSWARDRICWRCNGEPAEMTESSPTSETFQRNGNNSHDSEIECEVNNDSQELEDFISAQRSSNTVKKSPI